MRPYMQLLHAAFDFRQRCPWTAIGDDEFYAVEMDDGEVGYIRLTGMEDDQYGLNLYFGDDGFRSLLDTIDFSLEHPAYQQDIVLRQKCLRLQFCNRNELAKNDAKELSDFKRAYGINLRGKKTFPSFIQYEPYLKSRPIHNDKDFLYLTQAIYAALDLLGPWSGLELSSDPPLDLLLEINTLLKLKLNPKEGRYQISEAIQVYEKNEADLIDFRGMDELLMRRLKDIEKKQDFECALIACPIPFQDSEGDLPYYPQFLLAVDDDFNVYRSSFVRNYRKDAGILVNSLLKGFYDRGIKPGRFFLDDERVKIMLTKTGKVLFAPILESWELFSISETLEEVIDKADEYFTPEEYERDTVDKLIPWVLWLENDDIPKIHPCIMADMTDRLNSSNFSPDMDQTVRNKLSLYKIWKEPLSD